MDVFQHCSSQCKTASNACGSFFTMLMGGFVLGLTFLTWYAVVPASYGPWMMNGGLVGMICGLAVSLVMTLLAGMIVWCYILTVVTDPGRVPHQWHPFSSDEQARAELQRLAFSDYYYDRRDPRRPRFCKRCQQWKPERTHHCGMLGRCVLKMDHYCVWVANCVGLLNYKFFLLFLIWAGVGSLSAFLLLLSPLIDFIHGTLSGPNAPVIFIAVIINFAFSLAITGFLLMHLQLIAANCTTIEMYEKDRPHPWPYNKGWRRNAEEIFGRSRWKWLIPYHSREDVERMVDISLKPGKSENEGLLSLGRQPL